MWNCIKENSTKIILVFAMIVLIIITFMQILYGGYSIYADNFAAQLRYEQVAACYKGCQFTTHPMYNNTVKDKDFRMNQYHNCVDKCENRYFKFIP